MCLCFSVLFGVTGDCTNGWCLGVGAVVYGGIIDGKYFDWYEICELVRRVFQRMSC